jgi:glutathione synthase/RimK-type ligase-like ATP-grasp enzyme
MKIILRQGNIVFSQEFIDLLNEYGISLTRRNTFNKSGILINHGNSSPIHIGKSVKDFFLINKPECIKYCSNKITNWEFLEKYYPRVYTDIPDMVSAKYPIIAKPIDGHHGYGVEVLNSTKDFRNFSRTKKLERYIVEDYIPIKHEFRFNVFDKEVFQVSRKDKLDSKTPKGGMEFEYTSLGKDAKLSDKFWDFVENVIKDFHKSVKYGLGNYCIDTIKGTDKKYYLTEINSAYGIGELTLDKLLSLIQEKYDNGELENYRER